MKSRQIGAVAAALVMSVSVAACGSSGGSYTALTKATFAKAVSDAAAKSTSVHEAATTSSASKLTVAADFNFQGSGAAQISLVATVGGKASTITWRVVGGDAYVQIPSGKDAGKWGKVPSSVANGNTANLNPKTLAALYEKDADSITYVGQTTIGGQPVRHYRVVLPTSSLGSSLASLMASAPSLANLKTISQDVYLSDSNLLQRIVVAYPEPIGSMQIDFTKWNQVAPITAPAANDLTNAGK